MNFKNKIICLLSFPCLGACSSLPTVEMINDTVRVQPVSLIKTPLNVAKESELGDALLKQEKGSYEVDSTLLVTLLKGIPYIYKEHPGIEKDTTTQLLKSNDNHHAACFDSAMYRRLPITFCLFDTNTDGHFNYGTYEGEETETINATYKISTVDKKTPTTEYLRQEVIYQGIIKNKLAFVYLEYKHSMTEPSVKQDFQIEMPSDAYVTFGYKGARFEVMKANNLSISYKVLANFR